MNIDQAFPTKFIAAPDLQGNDVRCVISTVMIETVGDDTKPVIYFQGKKKGLVLNKTNAHRIAEMYGIETDRWVGQPITLYPSETDFQGKTVPCIRIRLVTATATEIQAPNAPMGAIAGAGAQQAATQQSVEQSAKTGDFDDEIPF